MAMQLTYLTANNAWFFTFGQEIGALDNAPRSFASKADAVHAAERLGLGVGRRPVAAAVGGKAFDVFSAALPSVAA